jgi:hypothetical protein
LESCFGKLSWKVIVKQILCFEFKHAVPNCLYFVFFFVRISGHRFRVGKRRIQGNKEVDADGKDNCAG